MIQQLQQKAIPVQQACRVLSVSRAGYYQSLRRPVNATRLLAKTHLKAAFAASGQSYGSRRLTHALQAQGMAMGRHQVRSLMRETRIRPVWQPRFVATTDSKHNLPVADNLLNREFNPGAPNRAWTSDITYSTPSQRSPPAWG